MKKNHLIALCTILLPASAAADINLDVTPLRLQLHVMPGAEYTEAVEVLNLGEEPVRMHAYLEDWFMDEVGTPIFRTAATMTTSASPWITSAPSDFLLEPGETEHVRFTVRVPEDAEDGGYHCAIILENLPIKTPDPRERNVQVRGRIGTMIYVTVGHPKKSARIEDMQPFQRSDGTAAVRLEIKNDGEDFVRLKGNVGLIKNNSAFGSVEGLPDVPILPGNNRILEIDLPRGHGQGILARALVEIDGIGVLVGECPSIASAGTPAR